jgi:EmrB/QacA subfamily drug resistance transporter
MISPVRPTRVTAGAALPSDNRWWALAAVTLAQLMVLLDLTVMNLALPSMQTALGLSDHDRQWVLTVYALTYGSLLLLGGRLSDLIGRRRALLIGLIGFAVASALGAFAIDLTTLLLARGAQGVFGALLTPSVTALVAVMFPEPRERGRAFGIIGMIMGSGAGIGLILGGVLTDAFDWRSAFMFNLPVAVVAAVGILLTVRPVPGGERRRIDVPGVILATAGLGSLVFGASRAELDGWMATSTIGLLLLGAALITGFVAVQRETIAPLLPLRVLRNRRRVAAMLAGPGNGLGTIPAFLSLAVYFQVVRGDSPLETGLALLPNAIVIVFVARYVGRWIPRLPLVALLGPGLLAIAAALAILGRISADSSYLTGVVPVLVLLGVGTALVMPTANSTATQDAGPDTGVAGALVMTSMQVGIAFGAAIFGSLAASSAADYAARHAGAEGVVAQATAHGIAAASTTAAVVLAVLAIVVILVSAQRRRVVEPSPSRHTPVAPTPSTTARQAS